MTRDEFERRYAARAGVGADELPRHGLYAAPCDCGEPGCPGWVMLTVRRDRAGRPGAKGYTDKERRDA